MKRKLCVAMCIAMLSGGSTAEAADLLYRDAQTTFTAKAEALEIYKNNVLIPLDSKTYIKDGYMMLPLRAFLTSIDNNTMHWNEGTKLAWIQINGNMVVCNIKENSITVNGEKIDVSGTMEIKEGRIFVPLRNWKNILNSCGFTVEDKDIIWSAADKTAIVNILDESKIIKVPEGSAVISGKGEKANYTYPLSNKYDKVTNIGDGYFIASIYPERYTDIGLSMLGDSYYLIDSKGKELLAFENNEISSLRSAGENYMEIRNEDGSSTIIDRKGKILFSTPYHVRDFSNGIAEVLMNQKCSFIDEKGELIAPMEFDGTDAFSEGLGAVMKFEYLEDGKILDNWGFMDKNGNVVIDLQYLECASFSEGLAAVKTEDGWGYIDKCGRIVIEPQYKWAGFFVDGKTFVTEFNGNKTWVIDRNGNKLNLISEGKSVRYDVNSDGRIVYQLPREDWGLGDDISGTKYFDMNGEIPVDENRIRVSESEGISVNYDYFEDKRFYVNNEGVQYISDVYDKADPFLDGYAVVANEFTDLDGNKDVEWGIIKHSER